MASEQAQTSFFAETSRLLIRPIRLTDAACVQRSASQREIADTMISIPHPYPDGEAVRYVERARHLSETGQAFTFVLELKDDQIGGNDLAQATSFVGVMAIRDMDLEHHVAELSFWVAKEGWGKGYVSEALPAVIRFGFEQLDLNRLYAYHMVRNPASGRVLEKCGFVQEGMLRQRVQKWGQFEDVVLRALLKEDWNKTTD